MMAFCRFCGTRLLRNPIPYYPTQAYPFLVIIVNDNVLYHAQYWLLRTAPHAPMSGSNGTAPTPASSSSPNSLPNIPEALASEFPAWQSQFSIEF
jgi:hypothetical protein